MKRLLLVTLTVLLLGNVSVFAKNKIDHLEPAFWWVGMKNTNLQLLVHGENIAELQAEIDYPGVSIEKVSKVENPNYMFIDLKLSTELTAGSFDILFKKGKRTVVKYNYELKERRKGSAERKSFTSADAMYLITPDRFANGNPDNDNVKGLSDGLNREDKSGRHGGDIQGMIDNLDYISDMGFTSIWINPLLENNQTMSYHGYATTDYYKIDERFGSNEEYLNLSKLAEEKGIGIIMDVILNHCGSEHWWMKDMPSKDWINNEGEFISCTHKRTTVQDKYASKEDLKQFTDGWFVKEMPDLNQRNPFMANYLIQNAIWWVEYANLYGIRVDTFPYSDAEFLREWDLRLLAEYPNLNIVGEEWSTNPTIVSYWQKGKQNKDGYDSKLPSLMDFPMQHKLVEALTQEDTWGTGLIRLYELLVNDVLYPDPNNLVIFPDNHDMARIFDQVDRDYDLYKMAMTYVLTMRGIPQVYYGTEILAKSDAGGDHGLLRIDFPGGWAGDKVNAFTGQGLGEQEKNAQAFCKTILNWRKNKEVIHSGKLMHYAPDMGLYSFFRYSDTEKVMVILNKNIESVKLNTKRYHEMLGGKSSVKDIITGETFELNDSFDIPARSTMILEVN
ncbi:glycoside hydrolase family 13 protein [Labilibaculum sp. DW002]|uniref:Glycoside hydrolase family 13 protein n=1 Tax=Paralabilibaculum antarcticum TaxID=2912572 RepID=A0ABT5VVI0_9BACT|nr:glycoside hydrolase family 13 protein [Labilibaculum sp. DW002]MDE5419426.1 glycoside hydrolase family 13 protein [Labilibaculum sp. DW002]